MPRRQLEKSEERSDLTGHLPLNPKVVGDIIFLELGGYQAGMS